jgi:hypothetical protein
MRPTRALAATSIALVASPTALLTGCSPDDDPGVDSLNDDSTGTSSTDNVSDDSDAEWKEYRECLKDEGVDDEYISILTLPPGTSDEGLPDLEQDLPAAEWEAVDAAQDTCANSFPDLSLSDDELSELYEVALKHAECMRDRGYDYPDPDPDNFRGMGAGNAMPAPDVPGVDTNDPSFQKDNEDCADKVGPSPGDEGGGE